MKFPADFTFDADLSGHENVNCWLERRLAMRSILKSRVGRVSAVAAIAAAGVLAATAADARPWHYYHHGYYNSGPAFALGAFAGAVTGAAVASSYYHPYYYSAPPAYYYPPPAYRYGYNYNYNPYYGRPYYGPEPTYGLVYR
jgi:hypothetical protein